MVVRSRAHLPVTHAFIFQVFVETLLVLAVKVTLFAFSNVILQTGDKPSKAVSHDCQSLELLRLCNDWPLLNNYSLEAGCQLREILELLKAGLGVDVVAVVHQDSCVVKKASRADECLLELGFKLAICHLIHLHQIVGPQLDEAAKPCEVVLVAASKLGLAANRD